jgi:TolB protein
MKRITGAIILMLILAPAVQAAGFLDWLKPASSTKGAKSVAPADNARLLTLEPKESEMYPRAPISGQKLLVNVSQSKKGWVSRRSLNNGDPLNIVSDDNRALDSISWHGDKITFLSMRGNGLGLWEQFADGEGLLKRLHELNGSLTQPILLADGSLIAVRLLARRAKDKVSTGHRDSFNNWQIANYRSQIVRIERGGSERVLNRGSNPAVSPDGEWIAFSMPDGRDMNLYLMKTDGSELTQLPSARSVDVQPVWSPDGKWIVFTSNRAKADLHMSSRRNWDIWAIDREGRNLTQLTKDAARDGSPTIAADGRVYFHSDRKVSKELKKERQVKGSTGAFHIWSLPLPKLD